MGINAWIENNYDELMSIANKIIGCQDTQDIVHIVLASMITNKKVEKMTSDERRFYFISSIKLQYFSNNSKYHYQYRKHQTKQDELPSTLYALNEDYVEPVGMDFVYKSLENLSWFDRDLFLLYIELGTIAKVHEQTTIPVNSIGKYLRKTKEFLHNEYKQYLSK